MALPCTTAPVLCAERLYPLGYPVTVETADPHVARLVETGWGGWPQLRSGDPLHISIQPSRLPGPSHGRRPRFHVTPEGFRLNGATFDAASLRLVIRGRDALSEHFLNTALLTALDFSLFTPLHAACVVRNDAGILLCGDSGAGKSTLAYACARRRWTLLSDDSVHLMAGSVSTVTSFSSTIHLREPARALFPELRHRRPAPAPNGKQALEIRSAASGFRTDRTAKVERALFLSRRPGPPRLSPLEDDAALSYFRKYLWQPDLSIHQQRLQDLISHTAVSVFEYQHPDEAIDALEDLLGQEGVAA